MKFLYLIISILTVLIFGCTKSKGTYSDKVNHSLNTQAVTLEAIFSIVNIQNNTATSSGNNNLNLCTSRTADTIAGIVYDTTTVYNSDCFLYSQNSSGSFFTSYSLNYPDMFTNITVKLDSFVCNGKAFTGELKFWHISPFTIQINSTNLTVSDFRGTTDLVIDLEMNLNFNHAITGNIKGLGDNTFEWQSLSDIYGGTSYQCLGPQQHKFYSGKASFTCNGISFIENFGTGEEDDNAVVVEENDERKVLVLPNF